MKLNNVYYFVRHGQAVSNVKSVCSCFPESFRNPLTDVGERMVQYAANQLHDKKIHLIFSSDILRAKQTAKMIAKQLNLGVKFDTRLREINFGIWNGATIKSFDAHYPDLVSRFYTAPRDGESYQDISDRMIDFLEETEELYTGKNIVVVSHTVPITLTLSKIEGLNPEETFDEYFERRKIKNAEIIRVPPEHAI